MTIYTPTYKPETRADRLLDWFEANALIMFTGFTLGAILTGAAIF
ncbi:hypothetical protein [Mesorhizobium sp.]|nr:hypothetical protein [Mesorhizobium sp.]